MPSITFRIPKAMEKDYEEVKDLFNTSEVCQGALEREISYQLAAKNTENKRELMIRRLRHERLTDSANIESSAGASAAVDFPTLSYSHIQIILRAAREGTESQIPEILEWDEDWAEEEANLNDENLINIWLQAWALEIAKLWEDVEEEVEA